MKTIFKPLGIAAAVAAVTAGYAGVANAQTAVANNGLGDVALVPYYTTAGDFVTGVHIINTSAQTQVVKLRLRRATDSMDAMDFNLIMSPYDEWTGFITGEENGDITWNTADTTCTAPIINGTVTMSPVYRRGADSGYIEVIGMGSPELETYTIARDAKHTSAGVPKDCVAVASNFFANGVPGVVNGNVNSNESVQLNIVAGAPVLTTNTYVDGGNALKVSYFIRNEVAGLEFGNNAVHVQDFYDDAMMTNQEFGSFSGDMRGFDFPDLTGGSPVDTPRNLFNNLRDTDVLGVLTVLNDWSKNPANGVNTDWVVTLPGQYTMLNLPAYLATGGDVPTPGSVCGNASTIIQGQPAVAVACDTRDLPVTANFKAWDREEDTAVSGPGSLVVSPSIPGQPNITRFQREVNVVQWGDESVLDANVVTSVDSGVDAPFGWAQVSVSSRVGNLDICRWPNASFAPNPALALTYMSCDIAATGAVPMIGFVAWERNFPSNPAANYGRIVEHSYTTSN